MTYLKKLVVPGIATALVLLVAFPANAGLVARTGDKISLSEDQVVTGDFYVAGNTLSISGSVEGDVYAAGRTIVLNGGVDADAVAAAETVQVHGAVGDDVRVLGRDVVIAEHVGGDLVVLAAHLTVLSTATIDGEVIFFGREADIAGDVGGSITATAKSMRIDSAVDGSVKATLEDGLTLGDRAHIEGNVEYTSARDLVRAPGSVVVGNIKKVVPDSPVESFDIRSLFVALLALMFSALVYLLLFREHIGSFVSLVTKRSAFYVLVGLGVLVGAPVVAALLLVSVLGIPLGLTLLFLYLAIFFASLPLAGIVAGAFLSYAFTKKHSVSLVWVVGGVVVLVLLGIIPLLGELIILALSAMVIGCFAMMLYKKMR